MPALAEDTLTYRLLEPWEWNRIVELLPDKSDRIPNPGLSTCAVAQDGDKIVGFLFAQYVVHVEPLWVDKDYRGEGLPERLWEAVAPRLKGAVVYAFSPNGLIAKLLDHLGFEKLSWETYSKRVE